MVVVFFHFGVGPLISNKKWSLRLSNVLRDMLISFRNPLQPKEYLRFLLHLVNHKFKSHWLQEIHLGIALGISVMEKGKGLTSAIRKDKTVYKDAMEQSVNSLGITTMTTIIAVGQLAMVTTNQITGVI